jgi:hypothetical protein
MDALTIQATAPKKIRVVSRNAIPRKKTIILFPNFRVRSESKIGKIDARSNISYNMMA